jgi:hypothetical protein
MIKKTKMCARVAFYQLSRKFVNQREDIPENTRQVIYYTLAVGHHVGVLDCFSILTQASLDDYCAWLEMFPESPGKTKLEGVVKWGEIEINQSHVSMLLPLLESSNPQESPWAPILVQCLHSMVQEPAYYLMVRKHG